MNTPYSSTFFNKYTFSKIANVVRMLEIDESLVKMEDGIYAIPYGESRIPPLTLPLTKKEIPTLVCDVVVDGRHFLKASNEPARKDIYDFNLLLALLTRDWMRGNKRDLLQVTPLFHKFYSQWFRNTLSGRLGLDFAQVFKIQAIGAITFLKYFDDYSDDVLASRASRVLPGTDDFTLLNTFGGEFPDAKTFPETLEWIRESIDSPRASSLSLAYGTVAFSRTWGPAFKEVSLCAVEYPPVFAAMCYHSLKSNGFIRTDLGQFLKKTVRTAESTEFVRSMDMLINNLI